MASTELPKAVLGVRTDGVAGEAVLAMLPVLVVLPDAAVGNTKEFLTVGVLLKDDDDIFLQTLL